MKQKGVFIIYPTHGEQQQNEIKTIRKRVLELKLSDEDVKRISEKAGAVGLSVAELIENFIGDLVCGTYSNGSDERMYAEQWFERCGFGMFPENTFLRYLVEWGGGVDNVTEILRQYFINHPQSIDKYTFLQNSAFTHWVKEKCSKMC